MTLATLWPTCLTRLAAEIPEQQFNTWIRPLPPAEVSQQGPASLVVTLRVPNRFKLDWIRARYATRLEQLLSDIAEQPVTLTLALATR
nr:chromosomal replication initiator protein DnaA [Ideonella sp.]